MVETYYSQNDVSATNETTVNQGDDEDAFVEFEEIKDTDVNQINLNEAIYLRDNRFLDKAPGNFSQGDSVILNLILLNQPLNKATLIDLYERSSLVICADGGINHLYDLFEGQENLRSTILPKAVVGDLDSVRDEVR